ncbi:Transcription factor [Rhodotorula sphaerocarpa]
MPTPTPTPAGPSQPQPPPQPPLRPTLPLIAPRPPQQPTTDTPSSSASGGPLAALSSWAPPAAAASASASASTGPSGATHSPPPPQPSAAPPSHPAPQQQTQPPPAKRKRRNKVDSACRFCRKSHMQCSGERPCARCIKREIAHLCTDAPFPDAGGAGGAGPREAGSTPQVRPKAESPTHAGALVAPPSHNSYPPPLPHSHSNPFQGSPPTTSGSPYDDAGLYAATGPPGAARTSASASPAGRAADLGGYDSAAAQQQQQQQRSPSVGGGPGRAAEVPPHSGGGGAESGGGFNGPSPHAHAHNVSGPGPIPASTAPASVPGTSASAAAAAAAAPHAHAQSTPFASEFNLAMLDLAPDGLSSGLGLDMSLHGGGGPGDAGGMSGGGGAGGDGDGSSAGGGSEFHGLGLSEFLASLNDAPYYTSDGPAGGATDDDAHRGSRAQTLGEDKDPKGGADEDQKGKAAGASKATSHGPSAPGSPVNKTERFLLTAADQKDGSRSDRLARVIHAKFEAGLLRPYNHVAGYTRLMNMSANSRQRTLHTLSEFRPTFRAIASGLTDLDLVFIEEAFERLLLDYDRVFSSMGIPSCLWRRTGEIYKGNKEFAALVGVPIEDLQGGKLAIYELMAEESAVNYWEKYGNIAFDVGQKAVLTSCVLINQSILSRKRKKAAGGASSGSGGGGAGADKRKVPDDAMTIRRDSYGIPSMIVGNFIKL